ncbi:MAG: DNA polymerase III subunit gamma/tau [Firmicutes bacterium]|nr:DNA polymerase III subunit gamma/tau [Bacillota bacterium]
MAYLALYRKHRPKNFDEIVGQRAVVTALQNQVKYGQIGHAYLFCGTRGTGKTSTAKVFARAVNCLHPVNGNPCNECELCREAESGFNVIEIDAASNNGVDNIRDLREEVQYTPSQGRYKVYIIDEVHMLSTAAFNALLKTLEEPPEHAIFILATTDPQKVLPTIVSRCQRYDFRRITGEEITMQLRRVAQAESIEADDAALAYIATIADGGMRDALSILDQCHAYYIDRTITLADVEEVLGAVDDRIFTKMTDALIHQDVAALLDGVAEVFDTGRDALQFVTGWNGYLRNLLVMKVLGTRQAGSALSVPADSMERLADQAGQTGRNQIAGWIEQLARLEMQLKTASSRRILIEVAVIRLGSGTYQEETAPAMSFSARPMQKAIPAKPAAVPGVKPAEKPATMTKAAPHQMAQPVSGSRQASGNADVQKFVDAWPRLQDELLRRSPNLMALKHSQMKAGDGPAELILTANMPVYYNQIEAHKEEIASFILEKTGTPYMLRVMKSDQPSGMSWGKEEFTRHIHGDVNFK